MKQKKIEEMKDFFTNRVFIKDGSIEFMPDGSAIVTPSNDFSVGESCPYCGSTNIECAKVDSEDAVIEGGAHLWNVHPCSCLSCLGFYLMLINEAGERIIICERPFAKTAGKH